MQCVGFNQPFITSWAKFSRTNDLIRKASEKFPAPGLFIFEAAGNISTDF
jgi:hypothetical protein